ncbi:hypothetical protein [Rhizobium herbae]
MKAAFAATIVLALISSIRPCLSENNAPRWKTITEEEVRILSASLYRDILIIACKNGWRYPRKQLEHGFKRHLQELKLQLSTDGYKIVSATVASDDEKRRSSIAMAGGNTKSSAFGCARPYWLENRG